MRSARASEEASGKDRGPLESRKPPPRSGFDQAGVCKLKAKVLSGSEWSMVPSNLNRQFGSDTVHSIQRVGQSNNREVKNRSVKQSLDATLPVGLLPTRLRPTLGMQVPLRGVLAKISSETYSANHDNVVSGLPHGKLSEC